MSNYYNVRYSEVKERLFDDDLKKDLDFTKEITDVLDSIHDIVKYPKVKISKHIGYGLRETFSITIEIPFIFDNAVTQEVFPDNFNFFFRKEDEFPWQLPGGEFDDFSSKTFSGLFKHVLEHYLRVIDETRNNTLEIIKLLGE